MYRRAMLVRLVGAVTWLEDEALYAGADTSDSESLTSRARWFSLIALQTVSLDTVTEKHRRFWWPSTYSLVLFPAGFTSAAAGHSRHCDVQ